MKALEGDFRLVEIALKIESAYFSQALSSPLSNLVCKTQYIEHFFIK